MKIKYQGFPLLNIACGLSKKGSWAIKREGESFWNFKERKGHRYSNTSCERVMSDLVANPSRLNKFFSAMGVLELRFLHTKPQF